MRRQLFSMGCVADAVASWRAWGCAVVAIAIGWTAPMGMAMLHAAPPGIQRSPDDGPAFEMGSIRENRSVGGSQGSRVGNW